MKLLLKQTKLNKSNISTIDAIHSKNEYKHINWSRYKAGWIDSVYRVKSFYMSVNSHT